MTYSKRLHLRLTPEQLARLKSASAAMGMPTMCLIRRSLIRELEFIEKHEIPHRQKQLATLAAAYRKFEEHKKPFLPTILITDGCEGDGPS